jgi:N-methylhydantoinase A
VPIDVGDLNDDAGVGVLVESFHRAHRETFAVADVGSPIEIESWHARARCQLSEPQPPSLDAQDGTPTKRRIYLAGRGEVVADVWRIEAVPSEVVVQGPAIVETPSTAVLVNDGASFMRTRSGTLHVVPMGEKSTSRVPDRLTGETP